MHGAPVLSVRGLSKRYHTRAGERLVLDAIEMDVARGSFLCIVGPSGAGKTTLLRCMSGLLEPTDGVVLLDGERIDKPPDRLAVVFQDYSRSLMPWMSVERNVLLPLRAKGIPRAERLRLAREAPSGCPGAGTITPGSCPAACSSASPSPGRWPTSPRRC